MAVQHIVGPAPYYTNTFLIVEEDKQAVIIDPAAEASLYLAELEKQGVHLSYILLTHGHPDHTGAAVELKNATGAKVRAFAQDGYLLGFLPDVAFSDGESFALSRQSESRFYIIHTPGHTPGSCCIQYGDLLFSGDTLFCGSVGRTDLPGGDFTTLKTSLRKLCEMSLGDLRVLPGHGEFSGLEREKRENGYLKGIR